MSTLEMKTTREKELYAKTQEIVALEAKLCHQKESMTELEKALDEWRYKFQRETSALRSTVGDLRSTMR